MLSDVLHEILPKLVAATRPYLIEKTRFDYGAIGESCNRHLAGLIVAALEIDEALLGRAGPSPLTEAINKGDWDAVIQAYLPRCEREIRKFRQTFEAEMRVRDKLTKQGVVWENPEYFVPPPGFDPRGFK